MNTFATRTFFNSEIAAFSRRKRDSSYFEDKAPVPVPILTPIRQPNLYKPTSLTIPDFLFYLYLRFFLLSYQQLFDNGFPVGNFLHYGMFYIDNPWTKSKPVNPLFLNPSVPLLRNCARCSTDFDPTSSPDSSSACIHHWGKLVFYQDIQLKAYACCGAPVGAPGCTSSPCHVWSGVTQGINGPFPGFVRTMSNPANATVYALDCEMCYTTAGLEATKVTVVGPTGVCVYDRFIRPSSRIVDYNTRFSGVTEENLVGAMSLAEVQLELLGFISSETILVGHGLENDLRVLKFLHSAVIDTAVVFPHERGPPFRKSLKMLVKDHLGRDIQLGQDGHDSEEDAREAMCLMMKVVRNCFSL